MGNADKPRFEAIAAASTGQQVVVRDNQTNCVWLYGQQAPEQLTDAEIARLLVQADEEGFILVTNISCDTPEEVNGLIRLAIIQAANTRAHEAAHLASTTSRRISGRPGGETARRRRETRLFRERQPTS